MCADLRHSAVLSFCLAGEPPPQATFGDQAATIWFVQAAGLSLAIVSARAGVGVWHHFSSVVLLGLLYIVVCRDTVRVAC